MEEPLQLPPDEQPENVHYETVADAIRLSEAVMRKLDDQCFEPAIPAR